MGKRESATKKKAKGQAAVIAELEAQQLASRDTSQT